MIDYRGVGANPIPYRKQGAAKELTDNSDVYEIDTTFQD